MSYAPLLPTDPGAHPYALVGRAVEIFGAQRVVDFCRGVIVERPARDRTPDVAWLGGPPDALPYWHRTWGARGLLYAWDVRAVDDVLAGLRDAHWRVREMCLKVAIRRGIIERADGLERLLGDENHWVRSVAVRALAAER